MNRALRWRTRVASFRIFIPSLLLVVLLAGSGGGTGPSAFAAARNATLAILHFSGIKGSTWSRPHHRAAQRLAQKDPNVKYGYRQEVRPDATIPHSAVLILQGAYIV